MSRGTAHRSVRVPDDVWAAALAATEARGESISEVVRGALVAYAARPCLACGHVHDPATPGDCAEAECLPSCPEH